MPSGHSVLAPACVRCYIALRRGPRAGSAAAASAIPRMKPLCMTLSASNTRHPPPPPGTTDAAVRPLRRASAVQRLCLRLLPVLAVCGSAHAAPELPVVPPGLQACSIVQARAVPGGAALRFQEAEWRYHDSLGNAGRIDRRGVTRFSQRPSDPDSPPEPTLVVQSGAMLTLFEHHFGCTVLVDTVDGRTVLRIRRSFSYPGHPGRKDEYDVPL